MITKAQLQKLGREHGTPLFVVDHEALRRNYREFKRYLPRVQAYFAVKANPLPEIVRTFYREGASFDVASMPEFNIVYDNIKGCRPSSGRTGSGRTSSTRTRTSPWRRSRS
jgi:ornithine decarboxylase